ERDAEAATWDDLDAPGRRAQSFGHLRLAALVDDDDLVRPGRAGEDRLDTGGEELHTSDRRNDHGDRQRRAGMASTLGFEAHAAAPYRSARIAGAAGPGGHSRTHRELGRGGGPGRSRAEAAGTSSGAPALRRSRPAGEYPDQLVSSVRRACARCERPSHGW